MPTKNPAVIANLTMKGNPMFERLKRMPRRRPIVRIFKAIRLARSPGAEVAAAAATGVGLRTAQQPNLQP
jgi:hypothetical protein